MTCAGCYAFTTDDDKTWFTVTTYENGESGSADACPECVDEL